ncbi:MAG TPA: TonB-dependent receptor [Chitinophagaceae bacterium]|nr:TonB-dependent receptor [Chitinophagaceae bacterium]
MNIVLPSRIMKGLLFFSLLTLTCLNAYSQGNTSQKVKGKISGRIIDSASGQNIESATVSLYKSGNDKPLTGATADKQGIFKIINVPAGVYTVVIEFVGYSKKSIANVPVTAEIPSYSVGVVSMAKSFAELKSVTVTTQAKLLENRIDKMVFNAEKDLTSQGGVATDILKKIPQVSVDIDGNVELAGTSSIRFLINGKPSTAYGSNISDVLQSIPASQIKSVEVITNPGARYDAEGLGGIINIILKKDNTRGINGNLSLTAGTRRENGSFNFNARSGTFGMNAFVSGNTRLSATTTSSYKRTSFDSVANTNVLLTQDGSSQFIRHGIETGVNFDWTYKKKNSFSGGISYENFGGSGSGTTNQLQSITDATGNLLSNIALLNSSHNSFLFHTVGVNFDYKRTFDKDGQELEFAVNSSFDNSRRVADNNQTAQPSDSLYYGINSENPGKQNETEIRLDYTQPITKDVKLGTGAKFVARDINTLSDVLSFQPGAKQFLQDEYLSNTLAYHQKVYAAYAEVNFPVSTWFDAKIGGRYERTSIDAFFSNAQSQVNAPGYNTFVPSIFFMKRLPANQTIKFSYSKRINRPDYRDLNPFINTSDPSNMSQGNPYLQPEIGNRFELGYSKDMGSLGSFMVAAFYRTSNHDIQPYVVYYPALTVGDSTYTNVSLSTNQNIGIERNIGASLFGDLHFTSKLDVRTNVFMFYRKTINELQPGLNAQSFNYHINMNISYQFAPTMAAEFFGNFHSARHDVQGRYPSFTSYSFAIRKQFWDKKGSLALTADNLFSEYLTQRTELSGTNFMVNSVRNVPFRSIGLNFTWKFGKLEFKKDNDDNEGNGRS